MASNIIKMVLKLDDKASPALGKVGGEAGEADKKFGSMKINAKALGVGLAAAGLAALGAAKAFVAMGQDFANQINLFNDMSTSTGLSVETLESLNLMAKATGVNLSGMERGLVSFQKSLGEARTGTGTLSKALETLQLDPNQFEDADDAIKTVLSSIAEYGDSADRAKLLNEAFGISAKDMAKVMQTGFGDSAQALDLLGLSIGESSESAKEAQRGLALYDLVLDTIKRSAFEAFLGGGGFAQGLSVVVGIAKGLATLLGDLTGIVVGFLGAVGQGIESLALVMIGDMDGAYNAGLRAQESIDKLGQGLTSVATLNPIKQGVKAALDFEEALEVLGREAQESADLMSALAEAQKDAAESTDKGTAASGRRTDSLKAEAAALAALTAGAVAVQTAVDKALGRGLSGAINQSGASLELLNVQVQAIASASASLIAPMTEAQKLLTGTFSSDMVELTEGAAEHVADLAKGYQELSKFEGLGLEEEIKRAEGLREQLASLAIVMGNVGTRALELVPAGAIDLMKSLEAAVEEADLSLEVSATLAEDVLRVDAIEADRLDAKRIAAERLETQEQIAGTIGAISGAMTAAAGGDIAGAAHGIGTALGASPIFGAIVGGLGAIAEIGKMTAREIKANAVAFVDNLIAGFEVLIEALPDLVTMLVSRLPIAIINGMFTLIPSLIAELPAAIFAGFVKALTSIGGAFFGGKTAASDEAIAALAWREEREQEHQAGLSRQFAMGSAKVGRTGMALIHRGETIIPAGGRAAQDRMTTGGGVTVNISTAILDRDVIPRLVREIDRAVGTYGRTSAAFAGS